MVGKKNNPTHTHTTLRVTGAFVIKCLWIKALLAYLQKEATETPEILQESQPQAGRVRQRKALLSKNSLRGVSNTCSRAVEGKHSGPLTWSSHEHHLQLCAQEIILRAELDLTVLTQKGTAPAPDKQSKYSHHVNIRKVQKRTKFNGKPKKKH